MRMRVFAGVVLCLLIALGAGLWLRSRGSESSVAEGPHGAAPERASQPTTEWIGEGSKPKELPTDLRAAEPAGKLHVAGRVVNHNGTPAVGCRVTVSSWRQIADIYRMFGKTDEDGTFRFDGLPANAGALTARDSVASAAGRVTLRFDLSNGKSLDGVELRLPPSRVITVTVVDARGRAVAGAQVALSWEREIYDAPERGCVATSELGIARLTSYEEFPVVAVVEAPAGARRYLLPLETRLYPDDDNEVRFVLEDAGIASGIVLTPRGRPFKGGVVATIRDRYPIATTQADAEGRFEATIPEGEAVALAIEFGEKGPMIQEAEDASPVRVKGSLAGVRAGAHDLVLQLQVEPLDRSLRVKVESPTGGPVAAAAVRLFEVWERPASARVTDQLGVAAFTGLPPTRLQVEVSPPEGDPSALDWTKGIVQNVEPKGQELVVRLRAGFRISGVVLKPDGEPCAGASVCTYIARPDSGVVTVGADGRFSLLFDSEDVDRLDLVAWGEADGMELESILKLRDRSVREVTIRLERKE